MSAEAKEIAPPKVQPRPVGKPNHPLFNLCMGKARVVLKQKGNNNTISGACKWFRNGFLKLTETTIEFGGREEIERIDVPWVLVEIQTISYLRPEVVSKNSGRTEFGGQTP